jgi:hypothetical protein
MPHNTSRLEAVATIGIDIGKNTFHLIGLNRNGVIVLRQKLSRRQIEVRLANTPPCLIGMEACAGAHHLSRQLKAYGHDARLMPARYVRPYSRAELRCRLRMNSRTPDWAQRTARPILMKRGPVPCSRDLASQEDETPRSFATCAGCSRGSISFVFAGALFAISFAVMEMDADARGASAKGVFVTAK